MQQQPTLSETGYYTVAAMTMTMLRLGISSLLGLLVYGGSSIMMSSCCCEAAALKTSTRISVANSSKRRSLGDDEEDYMTFVLSSSKLNSLASICDPDLIPDGFDDDDIVEQRISFRYAMYLAATGDDEDNINNANLPLVKVQEIEKRMHDEVSRFFLKCGSTAVVENQNFYVNSIMSYPPDELQGECQEQDQEPSEQQAGDCYDAKSHFTAEISYRTRRALQDGGGGAEQQQPPADSSSSTSYGSLSDILSNPEAREYLTPSLLSDILAGEDVSQWLTDSALVSAFGSFLVDLFESGDLLEDDSELVGLVFKGFENGYAQHGNTGDVLSATPAPRPSPRVFTGSSVEEQNAKKNDRLVVPFVLVGVAAAILIASLLFVVWKKRQHNRLRTLQEGKEGDEDEIPMSKPMSAHNYDMSPLERTMDDSNSAATSSSPDDDTDQVFVLSDRRQVESDFQQANSEHGFEVEPVDYDLDPDGSVALSSHDALSNSSTVALARVGTSNVRISPCRPSSRMQSSSERRSFRHLHAEPCVSPNTVAL